MAKIGPKAAQQRAQREAAALAAIAAHSAVMKIKPAPAIKPGDTITLAPKLAKQLGTDRLVVAGVVTGSPDTAAWVKAVRAKTGLTQAAFAKKYKISQRTLEGWERGASAPSSKLKAKLNAIEGKPS